MRLKENEKGLRERAKDTKVATETGTNEDMEHTKVTTGPQERRLEKVRIIMLTRSVLKHGATTNITITVMTSTVGDRETDISKICQ